MLPKNNTTLNLLDNVRVYRGYDHPHIAQGLPFFQPLPLPDPNDMLPFNELYDKDSPKTIVYHTLKDESEIPDEFKDVPIELDPSMVIDSNELPHSDYSHPGNKRIIKKWQNYR